MRPSWLAGLVLSLAPALVHATSPCCVWDFPASLAPDGFVLTVVDSAGAQTAHRVSPIRGEACGGSGDTFCAPQFCPGSGLFTLRVRASVQGQDSPESDPIALACLGTGTACDCIAGAVTPLDTSPSPTPDVPIPPPLDNPELTNLPADEVEKRLKDQTPPASPVSPEPATPMPDVTLPPLVTTDSVPESSVPQEPPTRDEVQQRLSTIRHAYGEQLRQIDTAYQADLAQVATLPPPQQAAAALAAYTRATEAQAQAYRAAQQQARQVYTQVRGGH